MLNTKLNALNKRVRKDRIRQAVKYVGLSVVLARRYSEVVTTSRNNAPSRIYGYNRAGHQQRGRWRRV